MSDISEADAAIARALGRASGANACVLAALISILIKHGAISQEVIEVEFIDGLRHALEPLVLSQDQDVESVNDDTFHASLSAKATISLLDEIESVLLRNELQP